MKRRIVWKESEEGQRTSDKSVIATRAIRGWRSPPLIVAALVLAAACGTSSPGAPTKDATTDGATAVDAGTTPTEAGTEVAEDSATEAGTDSGPDGNKDAAQDAAQDAALDAAQDAQPDRGIVGPSYALDMNDVTILVPLPSASATPVLLRGADLADDGTSLVPRALFDRLARSDEGGGVATGAILGAETHARLHLVAVRFDLCDRHLPGLCPEAEDARMRLVFQPLFLDGSAEDVGFHAFYAIRNDEISQAVATLRELATSVPATKGALRISNALSAAKPEAYATKLRAFVRRYGGEARLVRLTVNAQPQNSAQVRWSLRGVEKKGEKVGDAFVDIVVAGTRETSQAVVLASDYEVRPTTDTPVGFSRVLTTSAFDAADATKKGESISALASVENPMSQTAETVACVACHVSTVLTNLRTTSAALDPLTPLTVAGRYMSTFDLSTAAGKSAETRGTIRAFGYLHRLPLISQRVVNETAQTLTEIEARYPSP